MIIYEKYDAKLNNVLIPSKKEKATNSRKRKKYYKLMLDTRKKIISIYFPEHIEHLFTVIDSRYVNEVLDIEYIYCECKTKLILTDNMFRENNGTEYRSITETK